MRLDKPIESSGTFWLPEEPGRKFAGVLRISESGHATLELREETWRHDFLTDEAICVVGRVDQLGYVTLEQCRSLSFSRAMVSSTWVIDVRYVLVGVGFEPGDTPYFEQVRFSVEGLDDWLALSGFEIDKTAYFSNQDHISIEFQIPDTIEVPLSDDLDMEFCFGATYPSIRRVITEATIRQNAYIRLKSKKPLHIDDIVELSLKIRNFFCFAIGQTVSIRTFTVQTDGIRREYDDRMVPISVYFQSPQHPDEAPEIREHRMLFRYPEIKDDIGTIFAQWLDGYEMYRPTLDLYFTARFDFAMYLTVRFTNLVQALEAMHRRTSDDTVMPVEEFTAIRDLLLSKCPSERRDWLKARLQYDNELSLRQRLKRLIAPFREWFGNSNNREAFVGKVVDTRNYLTHYDQSLADRASNGQELYDLCEILDALIQLNLLKAMGFSEDAIQSIIEDTFRPLNRM